MHCFVCLAARLSGFSFYSQSWQSGATYEQFGFCCLDSVFNLTEINWVIWWETQKNAGHTNFTVEQLWHSGWRRLATDEQLNSVEIVADADCLAVAAKQLQQQKQTTNLI